MFLSERNEPQHIPYTKINLQCIIDLTIRWKTIKLQKENRRKSMWPCISMLKAICEKNDKLDFIKLKIFSFFFFYRQLLREWKDKSNLGVSHLFCKVSNPKDIKNT